MLPHKNSYRSGSILVLVAGLAALLLSLAVAVFANSRALNEPSRSVIQESRNRIMLSSALMYLKETAILGWGSGPGDMAFGWTDVRDGKVGPRGQGRDFSGNTLPLGWKTGGAFPAPGAVLRGDMFAWEVPPYALNQDIAPNPLKLTDADASPSAWKSVIGTAISRKKSAGTYAYSTTTEDIWKRSVNQMTTEGHGTFFNRPVYDTWANFEKGSKKPVLQSMGKGWFRIYREVDGDRDGKGDPWYDTVAHAGSGTFIVTVGSGSTRGFRFWDNVTDYLNGRKVIPPSINGISNQIEPTTAKDSGLFASEAVFAQLRRSERIAWYRVQWVGSSSDGFDPGMTEVNESGVPIRNRFTPMFSGGSDDGTQKNYPNFYGGAIRWIQRLEQEPPKW